MYINFRLIYYRISRNFIEDLILALLVSLFSSLKFCITNNTSLEFLKSFCPFGKTDKNIQCPIDSGSMSVQMTDIVIHVDITTCINLTKFHTNSLQPT